MENIFGWRRFSAIVLALLLVAVIEVISPDGLGSNARDALIGTLGFYFASSAASKMSPNTGKEA